MSVEETYQAAVKAERTAVTSALYNANAATAVLSSKYDWRAANAWSDAQKQASILKAIEEKWPHLGPQFDTNRDLVPEVPNANASTRFWLWGKYHDVANDRGKAKQSAIGNSLFGNKKLFGTSASAPTLPSGALDALPGGGVADETESQLSTAGWLAVAAAVGYLAVKVIFR
jgi:hypothetical protein